MSLITLQLQAGVKADGSFGPVTFRESARLLGLTHERAVHFFAQCAHETGGFMVFEENMNYSAEALMRVFPRHFRDLSEAQGYARQPERIANRVYANRMANRDEASGDGWAFRGRGALQLTGRDNYTRFADSIGFPGLVLNPDLVATEHAFTSAKWFFDVNNLWRICDKGFSDAVIRNLTKRINGGYHGLDDRIARTKQYSSWRV